MQKTVYLGLGCNVGDRIVQIRNALLCLHRAEVDGCPALQQMVISSLYENPAWLPEGAPKEWDMPFLNLVVRAETALPPETLLQVTQAAEKACGRVHRGTWGPREMDVDILDMTGESRQTELLTLPHPGLSLRPFVLVPLAEIAPDWRHANGQSATELLRAVDSSQTERFCAPISVASIANDRG